MRRTRFACTAAYEQAGITYGTKPRTQYVYVSAWSKKYHSDCMGLRKELEKTLREEQGNYHFLGIVDIKSVR